MILNVNRLVSVWRGNSTPPTNYHIWIKEDSTIWYYKDKWTLLSASDDSYDVITARVKELEDNLKNNYYDKDTADKKFISVETDPTVPSWAKQPSKPTYKTSELTNDIGFITKEGVPSKTSLLTNDSGFVTASSIPTKVSLLTNDKNYITAKEIPLNVSLFKNDAQYITSADIPKDLSEFNNDADFITKEEAEKILNGVDAYTKEETDKLVKDLITELKDGIPAIVKDEVSNQIDDAVALVIDNKKLVTEDLLNKKANIESPEFTGTPSVPTAATDSESTSKQIANVEYVNNKVNAALAGLNLQLYAETNEDGKTNIELRDDNGNVSSDLLIVGKDGVSVTTDLYDSTKLTIGLGSHASTTSDYGLSSETEYGHTKIVNEFEKDDFGTVVEPSKLNGVAASPYLVYEAVKDAISVVSPDTWRPVEAVTEETMDQTELIQEVLDKESANTDQTLKFGPGLLMKDGVIDISWSEILGNNINYKI